MFSIYIYIYLLYLNSLKQTFTQQTTHMFMNVNMYKNITKQSACYYMAIRVNRRWATLGKDPQYP